MYYIQDFETKLRVNPSNLVFTGEKGPWEVVMDIDEIRSKINPDYFRKAPPYASKYLPFMPIRDYSSFVSLQEGATPLLQSKALGQKLGLDLWFKLEQQNPTGSFKDRGSAVDLTLAREFGAKGIAVASTGNMAASCSCYAAAAKMPCFVFVPEGTPPTKLAQVIAFGGHIVQVKGTYNDAAKLAQKVAEELGFYLAGDYAFRIEGAKTAAFEIIDQLFFQAPDAVIVPMGCGTNITAIGKGFNEYKALGLIERSPRLIGVQATGASSIINSFSAGSRKITPLPSINTIASAIAVADPLDGAKALSVIYDSNGYAVAVSDTEMLEAQYMLSKEEGHFVEVSCASAVAALIKLAKDGSLRDKRVVCVLTGTGLKDPNTILRVAIKPPTIHPEVKEFLSLYKGAFFEGKSVSFFDRNEVVFNKIPTADEVQKNVTHYFNAAYSATHLRNILHIVEGFLKKGKPVTFSDLQDIVQDALEMGEKKMSGALSVVDFQITTGKDRVAEARVVVRVHDQERVSTATGVGPVDAVINALKEACGDTKPFTLRSYRVGIRSEGTDAVTTVDMTLVDKDGKPSVGTGTSPDIIQASIEAFDEAYNGFF
jgi:threonine synthase